MEPAEHRLMVVLWEDTTNVAEWMRTDEAIEWAKEGGWFCHNVGWLTHEDEDCVVLSARMVSDQERHVGLTERIPRRAIIRMWEVPWDSSDGSGTDSARAGDPGPGPTADVDGGNSDPSAPTGNVFLSGTTRR